MTIHTILSQCRKAATMLHRADDAARQRLTLMLADSIANNAHTILEANAADCLNMDPGNPMLDRLRLTHDRLNAIVEAIRKVARLPDPCGKLLSEMMHPKGFTIQKKTVPLGVVGAVYESRPNVTADIAALCLRSGNGVALKGGSDAAESNACLVKFMQEAVAAAGFSPEMICLLPNSRAATAELLQANQLVDVLIPRGSQQLIDFVRSHATIPVIETGAGVCHVYVHADADMAMATNIVVNAKTQRPSVCNAMDTLLVDRAVAGTVLGQLAEAFRPWQVGIFADEGAYSILAAANYRQLKQATPTDFGHEFLSLNCSIKIVDGLPEALAHISQYSSRHSECIVTNNKEVAQHFLLTVDAAAVYHNVSTRFTDGAEFGLGAEMGISTQKLHARGPFALEKLVGEKWFIEGNGQIR